MSRNLTSFSKKLSWLLRHGAPSAGLQMDAAGWVDEQAVLAHLRCSRAQLAEVVRENSKQRLQWKNGRIRCSQGHSSQGMPVTQDALEASWVVWTGAASLWHGTHIDALPAIARDGLLPMRRTHVHLAPEVDAKVGKRANVHVLLEVSPARLREAGFPIFQSPNGVLLVRRIPPGCLVGLRACTRRARSQAASLRALLLAA